MFVYLIALAMTGTAPPEPVAPSGSSADPNEKICENMAQIGSPPREEARMRNEGRVGRTAASGSTGRGKDTAIDNRIDLFRRQNERVLGLLELEVVC